MIPWLGVAWVVGAALLGLPDPVEDLVPVPLLEGQEAPFAGILTPYQIAARLTAKAEYCEARVDLAIQRQSEIGALDMKLIEDLRHNDKSACDLQLKLMALSLEEVRPRWWRDPSLWLIAGIAVGACVGAIFLSAAAN